MFHSDNRRNICPRCGNCVECCQKGIVCEHIIPEDAGTTITPYTSKTHQDGSGCDIMDKCSKCTKACPVPAPPQNVAVGKACIALRKHCQETNPPDEPMDWIRKWLRMRKAGVIA